METDKSMFREDPFDLEMNEPIVHHYRHETVGPTLYHMFGSRLSLIPESIKSLFLEVDRYLRSRLSFGWEFLTGSANTLLARAQWRGKAPGSNPLALSLASIHFPLIAEEFAPCYRAIARDEVLIAVRGAEPNNLSTPLPEVSFFKMIGVCILISVAGILGGQDYNTLRHITCLDIRDDSVDSIRRFLDQRLSPGLAFWQAVMFVAVFHRELIRRF